MRFICRRSRLCGDVTIPGSKSHTIRAVAIASLARGDSRILAPLESADTLAAVEAYRRLGAEIDMQPDHWRVRGTGGALRAPDNVIIRNGLSPSNGKALNMPPAVSSAFCSGE